MSPSFGAEDNCWWQAGLLGTRTTWNSCHRVYTPHQSSPVQISLHIKVVKIRGGVKCSTAKTLRKRFSQNWNCLEWCENLRHNSGSFNLTDSDMLKLQAGVVSPMNAACTNTLTYQPDIWKGYLSSGSLKTFQINAANDPQIPKISI